MAFARPDFDACHRLSIILLLRVTVEGKIATHFGLAFSKMLKSIARNVGSPWLWYERATR
jgi:hypothetical protein